MRIDLFIRAFALSAAILISTAVAQSHESDSSRLRANRTLFDNQLASLIKDAVNRNAALKAADARIGEIEDFARVRTSFEPPRFSVEVMDASVASFPNPFKDQMEIDYSVEQMFMFPGKLSTMRRAELRRKEMAEYDRSAREWEMVKKIQDSFFEIYLVDRQIAINHQAQNVVSRIIEIARKQYEVGMGKQADILRAQTELSLLRKKMATFDQRRRTMTAMINSFRNRPLETLVDTTSEILVPLFNMSTESFVELALVSRPELKAMKSALEMKKTELTYAQYEWLPDFSIKGTYQDKRPMDVSNDPLSPEFGTAERNRDAWSIMFEMSIPAAPWSWGKITAAKRQAHNAITAAQADIIEMENMIRNEAMDALYQLESTRDQLRITETTLLPQAMQSFESALASYRFGGEEFVMVLDAQRMLLMVQDDYHMTVMSYLNALAKLQCAACVPLETLTKKDGLQ